MPTWLKRLTLFFYYLPVAVLAVLLLTGDVFRYEWLVFLLMIPMLVVAAIHTGRVWWKLGLTKSSEEAEADRR